MDVDTTIRRREIGTQCNYHKGRAAIRHYTNLREPSFNIRFKLYSGPSMTKNIFTSAAVVYKSESITFRAVKGI